MKKMVKLIVYFLLILFSGCILFESVDQPTSALPGDIITVSIDVTTEGGSNAPYFGVCLPSGWTIPGDAIPCTGVYNGTIYYDNSLAEEQENISPAPEGYYWWVGIGNEPGAGSWRKNTCQPFIRGYLCHQACTGRQGEDSKSND